jgi:hypothetical protein
MKSWSVHFFLVLAVLLFWTSSGRAGYSHYYEWKQKPDEHALRSCLEQMHLVVAAAKNLLAGPDGDGKPKVEALQLEINGRGEESHEAFIFPAGMGWNSCKTAGKPYDAVVTACLLIARDHFDTDILEIASDGEWEAGDWADGARLYEKVVGKPAKNPMGSRERHEILLGQPANNPISRNVAIGLLLLCLVAARIVIRRRPVT